MGKIQKIALSTLHKKICNPILGPFPESIGNDCLYLVAFLMGSFGIFDYYNPVFITFCTYKV
jgi:hypothetical protein